MSHTLGRDRLDRPIQQQFTIEETRYDASLAHVRRYIGPGWLYELEGRAYYSPTSHRPNVKIPPSTEVPSDFAPSRRTWGDLEQYREPQWSTRHTDFLAFIPSLPDLSAPPLYPLLCLPEIVDDPELGPHPEPHRWNQWKQLQHDIIQSCNLLLQHSGAPALRAALPYPCRRVDSQVEARTYLGKKAKLYHDILLARSLFMPWFGCLSYAIAVNEAIIREANSFPTRSNRCPPSWVELLLGLPQAQYRSIPRHPQTLEGYSLTTFHWQVETPAGTSGTVAPTLIDATFVSNLRNTCIANFDGSVERVGVFLEIPDKIEDIISLDWLIECRIPIWYPWGKREENIVAKYPRFARYRPPHNVIRSTSFSASTAGLELYPASPMDLRGSEEIDCILLNFDRNATSTRYERRQEVPECDRIWEEFFSRGDSREQWLREMETLQAKQERETRNHNPPLTRPETKFYVWDRGMRGTFRRRVATDEEIEGIFEEKGHFGRKQARYNGFYNEWDLCRYWGPPDDVQILFRSKRQANLKGTRLEAEVLWWQVYYGLQPDPSLGTDGANAMIVEEDTPESAQSAQPLFPSSPARCEPQLLKGGLDLDHGEHRARETGDRLTTKASMDDRRAASPKEVLEDGEIPDTEVAPNLETSDVSLGWISRQAYYFLGFTSPLPDAADILRSTSEPQNPMHAPRLLGISKGRASQEYWNSREGQSIISFAKSLASVDPSQPSSWDLHRWNAMSVTSLPLFRRLKSFQGEVVVQIERWDNVKGRLTPALLPQTKVAFWLDIAPKNPHSIGWYLGSENPVLALALCRLGTDLNSDPLSIAWYLAERGVPFHTWYKRRPCQVQPLEIVRTSPRLIQFRLDPQHRFTSTDYEEYVRFRRRLLDGPAGQAALKAGGICWRLATEDIGVRCVISGEPSQEALLGQRVLRRDDQGGFLVDDGLNHDEVWAICGEYEMGISTPISLNY